MRFLIVSANNSLSHIGKSLALEASLRAKGHEVFVAVSRQRAPFVRHLGDRGRVLPDVQETDYSSHPTVTWFRDPQRIVGCIQAEVNLLKELRPDRVLGVFRFTLKASARLAGVPYDSLVCGCMLPETLDVLGFAEEIPGIVEQRNYLGLFYGLAGARMSRAMASLGLEGIADIRMMLKGDRTFLWDFPLFAPMPDLPNVAHVGPIPWSGWSHDEVDLDRILASCRPLAVLTFGTCVGSSEVGLRMARSLRTQGYQVVLAAGGQDDLLAAMAGEADVIACRYAPLHSLIPHAALVVCHGGQMTVFEALSHRVPVLVMPFQAEQAHNGVCLERMGCGRRLTPSCLFLGDHRVYVDAFNQLENRDLAGILRSLVEDPRTAGALASAQATLAGYDGVKTLTHSLEVGGQ